MQITFNTLTPDAYKQVVSGIIFTQLSVILLFAITLALFSPETVRSFWQAKIIIHLIIIGVFMLLNIALSVYGIYIGRQLAKYKQYRPLGDRLLAFSVLTFPLVPTMPVSTLALASLFSTLLS